MLLPWLAITILMPSVRF